MQIEQSNVLPRRDPGGLMTVSTDGMPDAIHWFIVTPHARRAMMRRGLTDEVVRGVLASPEQRRRIRAGRDVLQTRRTLDGGLYLVRVFVDVSLDPPQIVTAYRTSKVGKYWSGCS